MKYLFIPSFLLAWVFLSGSVIAATTLQGKYEYRTDAESQDMQGRLICFFPEARFSPPFSQQKENKTYWFCFANTKKAARLLAIDLNTKQPCGLQGQATVRVDHYQLAKSDTDNNDSATLKQVLKKTKSHPITCSE